MSSHLSAEAELRRLLDIMAALRDPSQGCPWDRQQTFASIAPYTIEEAYEVAGAIARHNATDLADELGDLLFQVVYHARMAQEAGWFEFADVVRGIADKMVRRHPHVFGDKAAKGTQDHALGDVVDAQRADWEAQKAAERASSADTSVLAGIPSALPALLYAFKLTTRAARVGFDWPDAWAVLEKLDEEVAELRAELPAADPTRLEDELGDMLFVLANLARKLNLDPEACLRQANRKFTQRFQSMERYAESAGRSLSEMTLQEMDLEWKKVKKSEP